VDRSRDNDQPIELDGRKIRLRDWHEKDLAALRSQLDPARPWHDTNGPYFGRITPEEADAMTARMAELAAKDPASLPHPRDSLAIAELTTDHLLGQTSWYWECEQTDWRRLGLVIYDEAYWGQGYGTDALRLWTSYLFAATDTLRLDFATYSGNPAMIAVGRRLGFVEEARFRQARRWPGGVHDSVVLGVLRDEWQHQHPTQPATADPQQTGRPAGRGHR